MSDETNKEIQQRFKDVIPDPHTASKVVDLIVHNRPQGWSRKSNATYYKEKYAKQLKEVADEMINGSGTKCFRYKVWCNEETGMTENTLYTRINQSIRYLIDFMDDKEHIYANWYENVNITRERNVGVVIKFIVGMSDSTSFKPEEVQPKENTPLWRSQMDNWLEGDSQKPFCVEGLMLSPQDVIDLTTDLAKLSNVQASVKSESVKIIRVN
jgi:hypothetical protein